MSDTKHKPVFKRVTSITSELDTIIFLAKATELVYSEDYKDFVENPADLKDYEYFHKKAKKIGIDIVVTKAYIVGDQVAVLFMQKKGTNDYILAFKGTSSFFDSFVDADITKETPKFGSPNVKVHSGFYQYYCDFRAPLWEDLNSHIKNKKIDTLYVTGHSLGCAIATMFTYDFFYRDVEQTMYHINFASPTAGDYEFAKDYYAKDKNRTLRVVNYRDVVPDIPTDELGFYHAADEFLVSFYIHNDIIMEAIHKELPDFDQILHPLEALKEAVLFRHSLECYQFALHEIKAGKYHPTENTRFSVQNDMFLKEEITFDYVDKGETVSETTLGYLTKRLEKVGIKLAKLVHRALELTYINTKKNN